MGGTQCTQCFKHISDLEVSAFKHAPEGKYKDGRIVSSGFACLTFSAAALATLSTCPKTCEPCSEQFRPLHWQQQFPVLRYKDILSDVEATEKVASLTEEARKGFAQLSEELENHGNAIMKRWTKRNQQKRKAVLQQAMPKMFKGPLHRHVVSDLCCADLGEHQTALLFQYLDLESLSEDPNILLSIMHYRCNTKASDCVMFDSLQLKAFFSQGLLEASYNPHCVVMHDEDNNFGALMPWEKELAHEWSMIGFPRAKLILEAQAALSQFLCTLVHLLLHSGHDKALEGNAKWKALVEGGFTAAEAHRTDIGILGITNYLPPNFSMSSIHEAFGTRSKKLNLTGLMLDTVERQQIRGELTDEAKYALDMSSRHFEGPSPISQSLEEYKKALNFLESRLRAEFPKFASRFRDLAITLGTFDEHFSFEICHQALVKSSRAAQDKDEVFWCASRLHDHATQDVDYPGKKLQTIERYSYHPTSQKRSRLHQLLLECVSDMRTVDNAIMSLLCHRPRSAGAVNTNDIEALMPSIKERAHWNTAPFITQVDQKWSKHLDRLWPPLEALLNLPSMSGLVTRKALDTFDKNHKGLHDFWEQARLVRRDVLVEMQCPKELHAEIIEPVAMGISPDYLEARDEERKILLKQIEAKEAAVAARVARKPVARTPGKPRQQSLPVQTEWGTELSSTPKITTPKTKIKTRPDDTPPGTANVVEKRNQGIIAVEAGLEALSTREECIKVSAATMDIVNWMFTSYGKQTQSNVRRDHFVNAMIDIGIRPSQSEGSAVTFKDVTRGKGAIVLHRPHPDPSVNTICMRSFGKRLQKNFGWELEITDDDVIDALPSCEPPTRLLTVKSWP